MCVWGGWLEGWGKRDPRPRPPPKVSPGARRGSSSGFLGRLARPRGEGLRPLGVARGSGGSSPGWPRKRERGGRGRGFPCGPGAAERRRVFGGQPWRTAAPGRGGRKSSFTQTAHRLGNNAVKEVSRLGLTAPTSCSHTHQRGEEKKKRSERKKKRGEIRISLQEQQTVCRRLSAWKVGGFRLVPPRNSPEEGS